MLRCGTISNHHTEYTQLFAAIAAARSDRADRAPVLYQMF